MTDKEKLEAIKAEIERFRKTNKVSENKEYAQYELDVKCGYDMALDDMLSYINSLSEEPVSEELWEAAQIYYEELQKEKFEGSDVIDAFNAGAKWKFERVKEALLSEVLPCFMHGGEADEVVAKLDEVLNQKK